MTIFGRRPRCLNRRPRPLSSASPRKSGVQKAENRIAPVDVLPDDDRYWNHLLPPVAGSTTLADYIGQELNAAWRDGLEADPVRALHGLAITFAAPELVPRASLQSLDADAAAKAIDAVSKVDDPFSLVGAFEICADRAAQDQRFVALGDRLLDSLFGDMQRLTGACALFGAIFVITTAHFATHETLQRRPVCLERAQRVVTYGAIFEIACRLVECTAVMKDRAEAARTLARRLEILALITPASEATGGLASNIEMLKRIQPNLAPLLGRALSTARLGSPRAA